MGFWNYFNYYHGAKGSAWNEYTTSKTSFGVVYITDDSVTDGKHWEATREGIEDYEYLAMLRRRVDELKARGVNSAALQDAARLLETAPEQVAGPHFDPSLAQLSAEQGRSAADRYCVRILEALGGLRGAE